MSAAATEIQGSMVFSHVGTRPGQEDYASVVEKKRIFVIADGFGGPAPGAAAARAACESVQGFLVKEAGDLEATLPFELRPYFSLAGNILFNALVHANRKVGKLNQGKGVHEKGGASVLAGYMDGDLLALASVGACSAWLFRGGQYRELVVPRTYARLCDPFQPDSNHDLQVPLMALGISQTLEPEIFEYRIEPGDWLLLQTDGVTAAVRDRLAELQRSAGTAGASDRIKPVFESEAYLDNASAALILF